MYLFLGSLVIGISLLQLLSMFFIRHLRLCNESLQFFFKHILVLGNIVGIYCPYVWSIVYLPKFRFFSYTHSRCLINCYIELCRAQLTKHLGSPRCEAPSQMNLVSS